MDTPLLWHIPLSHFNEKVRWALDYKRVAHHRQVLGANYDAWFQFHRNGRRSDLRPCPMLHQRARPGVGG